MVGGNLVETLFGDSLEATGEDRSAVIIFRHGGAQLVDGLLN